jgi:protein TonB
LVVAADGTVANAHASSATHPEFGQAATTAVEGWTFRPARRNGVAVNCRLEVPIVFTLNER